MCYEYSVDWESKRDSPPIEKTGKQRYLHRVIVGI